MGTGEVLSVDEARALYVDGDAAHDFDHVLRVAKMAVFLAEAEGGDTTVVWLAGLLHDVPARHKGRDAGRQAHHLISAAAARVLLAARGLGTEQIESVVHCIEAHRFRDRTIQPETIEAQCVFDADKLDSMGAIGIARVFAYAGAYDNRLWTNSLSDIAGSDEEARGAEDYTPVHEYSYKLDKLFGELHTASARRIGKGRHGFMKTFFAQLDAEMLGSL